MDSEDHDFIKRMARAEELKALAARAPNAGLRLYYLQLASAFRRLAEVRQGNRVPGSR